MKISKIGIFCIIGLFIGTSIIPAVTLNLNKRNGNIIEEYEECRQQLYGRFQDYLLVESSHPYDELFDRHHHFDEQYDEELFRRYGGESRSASMQSTQKPDFENGTTWYVDAKGEKDFTRIQDAIDNASDGDTVLVYSGFYQENVVIDKSIILQGENRETTIIDGTYIFNNIVNISACWVTINGFTIQNGANGIFLLFSSGNTITGNAITKSINGIELFYSSSNTITGNTITNNNWNGIYLSSSSVNTIGGNTIAENNGRGIYVVFTSDNNLITGNTINNNGHGIWLFYSSDNMITDNIFHLNGITITGESPEHLNTHTIDNNSANDRPIKYYKNAKDIIVPTDTAQVILANCTGFIIQDLNLSNVDIGLQLGYSSENAIIGNTISNNEFGILLVWSPDNKISGNTIAENNGLGIYVVFTSDNNLITGNTIKDNNGDGIILWSSLYNIISGNIITNNWYGIFLFSSCYHNVIYHNNFIDNIKISVDQGNNRWDNGFFGNYWSGYRQRYPDANRRILRPWVWNTAYEIDDGENVDRFPLSIHYSKDNIIFIISDLFFRLFNVNWNAFQKMYVI